MQTIFTSLLLSILLAVSSPVHAANWYVDSAAGGTNAGTSWTDAWTAFSSIVWGGAGVVAGDMVYISGGSVSKTYTATADSMLEVGADGTVGNLITIATGAKSPAPTGHAGKVIFDGNNLYTGLIRNVRDYIKIDGEKSGAINWEIRNTKRDDIDCTQHAVVASDNNGYLGNIYTYLEIHDVSNGIDAPSPGDIENALEVSYCWIYNIIGNAAIQAAGDGPNTVGATSIHHNTITIRGDPDQDNYGPDGIHVTKCANIYNNTFYAESGVALRHQHPDFIQSNYDRVRIYNNIFDGQGTNINAVTHPLFAYESEQPATIVGFMFYNNIVTRMAGGNVQIATPTGNTSIEVLVANNTIVDNSYSTSQHPLGADISRSATTPNFTFENNIIFNSGKSSGPVQAGFFKLNSTDQLAGIMWDYNLINAGAHGDDSVQYYVDSNVDMPAQAHGQSGIPAFVFYSEYSASNDYELSASDTAAKGTGTDLSATFTTDKIGATRGVPWDIGAYEFIGLTGTGGFGRWPR